MSATKIIEGDASPPPPPDFGAYGRTLRSRPTNQLFLDHLRFFTEFDQRSFSHLAPRAWNGLPIHTRLFPDYWYF